MNDNMAATIRAMLVPVAAMMVVVVASNWLVQFPINDWLTWGAFTYPFSFLVTDLINRRFGPAIARMVVYGGFGLAVALSLLIAMPRIALASGGAFLLAQLLDIAIFDRLRQQIWWRAPLISSVVASAVDTAVFFTIAFVGSDSPWITWGLGDYAVKLALAGIALSPYRLLMARVGPAWQTAQATHSLAKTGR